MFIWDSRKAILNFEKHGISFEEAATIFGDPRALDWQDPTHSSIELRRKRIGFSAAHRVLTVVYTLRSIENGKKAFRIISARQSSRKERKAYAG